MQVMASPGLAARYAIRSAQMSVAALKAISSVFFFVGLAWSEEACFI
jgi:hypothetical protein